MQQPRSRFFLFVNQLEVIPLHDSTLLGQDVPVVYLHLQEILYVEKEMGDNFRGSIPIQIDCNRLGGHRTIFGLGRLFPGCKSQRRIMTWLPTFRGNILEPLGIQTIDLGTHPKVSNGTRDFVRTRGRFGTILA